MSWKVKWLAACEGKAEGEEAMLRIDAYGVIKKLQSLRKNIFFPKTLDANSDNVV